MHRRTERGGGIASPPYSFAHSGPVIVAGNAWCLHPDLALARNLVGDVPVIAVNGAAREAKAVALYTKHPARFESRGWLRQQRRRFGDGFSVHGSNPDPDVKIACPWVQYWWQDARGGGGSAWGARKLAWLMGFDPVILCGCPMTPGPYVGNHSLGGLMGRVDVVEQFQREIMLEPEWHNGVTSVSGWTQEYLGGSG